MKSKDELNKIEEFTLAVDVTQDDINNGIRKDCNKCPFALAIIRAMNAAGLPLDTNIHGNLALEVDAMDIHLHLDGVLNQFKHSTSRQVNEWIQTFDYIASPFVSPIRAIMVFHKDEPEESF